MQEELAESLHHDESYSAMNKEPDNRSNLLMSFRPESSTASSSRGSLTGSSGRSSGSSNDLWACDGNIKQRAMETWTSKVVPTLFAYKNTYVNRESLLPQVDVYAIGVTLWCMLLCEMPFKVRILASW